VLERVKVHMIFQSIGVGLALIGLITGVIISQYYNRTRSFNSAHQILGILTITTLLTTWTLGFLSHRHYVRTARPLRWAILPHKFGLGAIAWTLGLVNAGLGFRLALATNLNAIFFPFAFAVAVLLFAASWLKPWFMRKWGGGGIGGPAGVGGGKFGGNGQRPFISAPAPIDPAVGGAGGEVGAGVYGRHDDGSRFGTRSDIALSNMNDPPPSYSMQPTKPREFA